MPEEEEREREKTLVVKLLHDNPITYRGLEMIACACASFLPVESNLLKLQLPPGRPLARFLLVTIKTTTTTL